MALIGGTIERKEIGLSIGVSGTHINTEIDESTGHLVLSHYEVDGSGKPIYEEKGTWTSDVVNLGDVFSSFEKVFMTSEKNGNSTYSVLTRVSENSVHWSDWKPIALDGSIQSDVKQYIQVKIDLFAGYVTDEFLIVKSDYLISNAFIEEKTLTGGKTGLALKRNYTFDMTQDPTWLLEGSLHRKKVSKADWLRVDTINVIEKVLI